MHYSTGKIAVITGAGSGIGRALAQQLNREGCSLYLSDIDSEGLEATRSSLANAAAVVDTRRLDVADRAAMEQWAADIEQHSGHIDILVNNAGVALMATVEEGRIEDIEWLMGINFWGVVYGTKAFLPLLRKAPQGHLVNLSSIFGMIGVPTQLAYNAAKFAVRGFTEALVHETRDSNLHVCSVHPGGIKTRIAYNSRGHTPGVSADEKHANFSKVARTTPESAASQIIRAIEKRKVRLLIGADAKLISFLVRLLPVNYYRFFPGAGKTLDSVN